VTDNFNTNGLVDIRLYAAALPWIVEGDAANGWMLPHRARAEKTLPVGVLILCWEIKIICGEGVMTKIFARKMQHRCGMGRVVRMGREAGSGNG
jgi:hypothetical protein